jgi:hypothetical protein
VSITLTNGRGQMGKILSEKITSLVRQPEVNIYHTWNLEDKSNNIQSLEYNKFKNFVIENKDKRIIFISTTSQKETPYVKYKQLSESFLIQNCNDCLILKFPTLIGKGIFYDFKNNTKQPYGEMNIMTIDEACKNIINNLSYNGFLKIKSFDGHKISAKLVYELVNL